MSAAAVQPLTLQPLALAQPGTDVSTAVEKQADHKYTSSSNAHGFCFICAIRLIVLYLAFVDLCSSQWGETAEGDEEEDAAEFGENRIWLKACTSFIRTRYLNDSDCGA